MIIIYILNNFNMLLTEKRIICENYLAIKYDDDEYEEVILNIYFEYCLELGFNTSPNLNLNVKEITKKYNLYLRNIKIKK